MREILDVEARRAQAIVAADIATLDELTDDAYAHIETSGRVRDKRGFLAGLADGTVKFSRYELTETNITVSGDVAWVVGAFENEAATPQGAVVKRARHLRVWVRRNGAWRNVCHQATALP